MHYDMSTAMPYRLSFLLLLLLSLNTTLNAQQTTANKIREALATSDCANVEGTQIKVCKYDYVSNELTVEAITFRPAGEGRFPGVGIIIRRDAVRDGLLVVTPIKGSPAFRSAAPMSIHAASRRLTFVRTSLPKRVPSPCRRGSKGSCRWAAAPRSS